MPRARPIPIPKVPRGFPLWRAAIFSGVALMLFLILTLGLTAYLAFDSPASVDTEEVSVASAERFGRFTLPPDAQGLRLQTRGTPLGGELFARFQIPTASLPLFVGTTPITDPLRPDRKLALRAATLSDKPWWKARDLIATPTPGQSATRPHRPFLAAIHQDDHHLLLIIADTADPATSTVYLYATNR